MKKITIALTTALFAANAFAASSVQWASASGKTLWADAQGDTAQGPGNHGVELSIYDQEAFVTITKLTDTQAAEFRSGVFVAKPDVVFQCWAKRSSAAYRNLTRAALGRGDGPTPFIAGSRLDGTCYRVILEPDQPLFELHWQDFAEDNGTTIATY